MTFTFKHVVISGSTQGFEGTSATINALTDVLTNDMGWSLVDDRRTQPGNVSLADTHKVVLSTDGEIGSFPTWYLTLASGINATVNSNNLGLHISNAYDVGTHNVPASGVQVPIVRTGIGAILPVFATNGHFNLWVSGDKDGVVIVWDANNSLSHLKLGRSRHFLNDDLEPFGLYYGYVTNLSPVDSNMASIVGNPAIGLVPTGQSGLITVGLSSSNEPRSGLGEVEPSFAILPLIHVATNGSNKRGAIGVATNIWTVAPSSSDSGSVTGTILTSRTSGRKYLVFANTGQSLALRIG